MQHLLWLVAMNIYEGDGFHLKYASSSLLDVRDTRMEDAQRGSETQHWWWSLVPGSGRVGAQGGWEIKHFASSETTGKIESNSGGKERRINNLEKSLAGKLGAEQGISAGASESSETPWTTAG